MLGLCHFCLAFSEFEYVSKKFYVLLKHSQKEIFLCFFQKFYVVKVLCSKKAMFEKKTMFVKKTLCEKINILAMFGKNIYKLRIIKAKTTESQHFSMLKFLDGLFTCVFFIRRRSLSKCKDD